jgi:hypothetical protein
MELVLEPDVYAPSIDENGNYIDRIPSFNIMKKGILCPCGSRKDKIYETNTMFSSHIKTKIHQKWLAEINNKKVNYYVEYEKQKTDLQNLRICYAKLEKVVISKTLEVETLTQKLNEINGTTMLNINLLDFD